MGETCGAFDPRNLAPRRLQPRRGGDLSSPHQADGGLDVAYLVSQYPWPSHVFIEREVAGLRALGARVETFSVHPTPPELLLGAHARSEALRTVSVQDVRGVADSLAWLARTHPTVLAKAARQAMTSGPRTARGRTWQAFYLGEAAHLYVLMRQRGLRHVHVHLANNSADIARLTVALGRGVDGPDAGWRWTLTMHGPTEFEAVERFDLRAKAISAARVACISDFTRSQMMRLVPPHVWPHLDVVRMSVDVDAYRGVERVRDPGEPTRVLYVGRLVPEKGAPLLVDALDALARQGVRVTARIVGAGELYDELEHRVAAAGLTDRVQLTGALGQDELPGMYAWADVFCLPSFQEGLPVVLMEAMATGLPVVTTAIAGIPELVQDRRTGRLLTAGRSDLLAAAIADLSSDPEQRHALGSAGRELVQREFSVEITSRQQYEFLRRTARGA